jgi:hypothetical protein
MRQSASTHSLIPIRTNQPDFSAGSRRVDGQTYQSRLPTATAQPAAVVPHVPAKVNSRQAMPLTPQRGLGISVSPSRVPVRAANGSVFANATMVQGREAQNSNNSSISNTTPTARAQSNPRTKLSEPFRTPVLGSKDQVDTPSPTYSTSLSPAFVVRDLDVDPHTGLTPTTQTFEAKKTTHQSSRLSKSFQLPSPPSSPASLYTSRIPRRSQDDLTLAESSRKLQIASSRPRRISIPSNIPFDTLDKSDPEMTVALAPPAPITIPPSDYTNGYPNDKPLPSAKSPGALASFFRWNSSTTLAEPLPDRLQTPSTLSHPTSPMTPTSPSVNALEQELRSVSADLAFSIRREMDLEDVITRLQDEVARLGGEGKRQIRFRTSDYFSENSFQGDSVEDERKERSHSRVSSVAVEDVRMANEKVTQLEKELLVLKSENLELMAAKREAQKKVKDNQREIRNSKKVNELEATVEQLRGELIEKTRIVESLQQTINRNKTGASDKSEEIKALTERAKGAESQREALQLALRQLRERQTLEAKRSNDRIKQLEAVVDKDRNQRHLPRTPERAVTGITHRTPDPFKRNTLSGKQDQDGKIGQLKNDFSAASKQLASLTITNTQLSSENTQLREMQQRLQVRLTQLEASASASTIGEASATASLSYAHRLAIEMARVTDIHMKSIEKVRSTAHATMPNLKMGASLSPMLQSAYDTSFSPKRLSMRSPRLGEDATVKMMETRIKELESALEESSEEMGEVVRKMQMAQIEMIELAGERDEAVRRERKFKLENESLNLHGLVKSEGNEVQELGIPV